MPKKKATEETSDTTKQIILKALKDEYFKLLKEEKGFHSEVSKQIDAIEAEIKKRTAELKVTE
jgi:hypothetical protein